MRIRAIAWSLLMCAALTTAPLASEAPDKGFEPVPEAQKSLYRWDLKKNFYADEAAWRSDLEKAREVIRGMEALAGTVASGPGQLLKLMDLRRQFTDLQYKLYAYGEFRAAVNTADRSPYEAYEALMAEMESRTSRLKVEVMAIKPETLDAWIQIEPRLEMYRYAVSDVIRMAPHTLSAPEESVLATLGPDLSSWQAVLFQKLFDRHEFAKISDGKRECSVYLDFDALLQNPDRTVREKAFKLYYAGLRSLSDLAGFSLLKELKALNTEARLRGFDTYYNGTLFERYLTRPQVDNIYTQIEGHLPLYAEFQNYRLGRIRADLNVEKAEIWDYELPQGTTPPPRFTVDQARDLLHQSLSVLGEEYTRELDRLLDPQNGRLDIVGGPNRDQGAFCEAHFGYFMNSYRGYMGDVGTMAHEAGHAMHHQLELNHRGTLLLGDGPGYMTESFATFNEWLLKDHLFKTEKDPSLLRMYHTDALNEMMYLWEIARRAKFEMVAYDEVAKGAIADEKGFDRITMEVGKKYDVFFGKYPELEVHWMRKHHYWSVPTYYVNYVVAQVLAMKYYQLYREDPARFPGRYAAMIRNGFDRPAAQCLKDFLGIDLGDPKLLEGTFQLISEEFRKVQSSP